MSRGLLINSICKFNASLLSLSSTYCDYETWQPLEDNINYLVGLTFMLSLGVKRPVVHAIIYLTSVRNISTDVERWMHIQLSAIITRSNITRYCIHHSSDVDIIMNQRLNLQSLTGKLWCVFFVRILEKNDRVITAPHCNTVHCQHREAQNTPGNIHSVPHCCVLLGFDCSQIIPDSSGLLHTGAIIRLHDDVIKWKHFPRNWPFVRKIHRSPVNFPHKGQWRGALMFSLIYVWINDWANNREAGDLRRQHGHYDVIVMVTTQSMPS